MKTLSIRQPWAYLVAHGVKIVENRTWYTYVRGPILIHASKTVDQRGITWCEKNGYQLPEKLRTGGIVGSADIVGIVAYADDGEIEAETIPDFDIEALECRIIEWFDFNGYGFVLRNAKPLPFKPCRGRLGFFDFNY